MIRNLFTRAITATVLSLLPGAVVAQPMLAGTFQVINDGPGDQLDPHIDCILASYTNEEVRTGAPSIRHFNLVTRTDAGVAILGQQYLSDVSGTRVAFTNLTAVGSEIVVFDTDTNTSFRLPGGVQRVNPSIAGSLVAFEDQAFSSDPRASEIVVYNLATSITTRLTGDTLMDSDPVVSPAGNAVVFEKCALSGGDCDIYMATEIAPGVFVTIAFVFHARGTDRGFKGTCHVIDRSAGVQVECLNVGALVVTGNHVTVFGGATINGVATSYRIDADDDGEPGGGRDRFVIQTSSGYSAAGVLMNGNVQVR